MAPITRMKVQGRVAQLVQRRHARHHEDASGHHGGSVDQRRNWRRAFHGIRQPHMQWKLRRLAHGADEQTDADHCDQHPVAARHGQLGDFSRLGKSLGVIQRAGISCDQPDAQNEAKVAHPIDQKGFHVGEDGSRLVEPESDQQVRNQTHRFPAKEQLEQVVAHHQHEHGEREQGDVGKEAVVAFVFFHVADGVDVNHQRHKGDDAHHHGREAVYQEAHLHLEAAHGHPGVERLVEARPINGHTLERHG
jgi:hypothetical protein